MAQRDTSTWHIARANELSHIIDAATERPTIELREFHVCVRWLETYAPHVDVTETVRCPENW